MKIILVVDGMGVGGIERVCIDYTRLFLKLGYDVTVLNLNFRKNMLEKELPDNVKVLHFNFPRFMAGEQYAQLIKKNAFGRFIYPTIFVILRFLEFFIGLLYKIFDRQKYDIAIAFSGHFNDLTFVADNILRTNKKLAWLHGALYEYLLMSDGYFNLYKKIINLVCLVDDAQDEALIYNHNKNLNINKLYNPTTISERKINLGKVNALKNKYGKFILMVSRFEYPHKDQYTVCDALRIIREVYNKNIDLVFVGSGPDEDNVKAYVKRFSDDVIKHIHFLGTQVDVQNYYEAAYLLVHASIAGEGLPTVQLEALAYQLPQVVTDSKVGPREILGDNEYGLLCKVKDPDDMAKKINLLLDNRSLYRHYEKVSKERYHDFQPNSIKMKLQEILENIMER